MKFRTVARPVVRPCAGCGGVMRPAKRYEATRTVDVAICWACGLEDPPLYASNVIVRRTCRWCSRRYTARRTDGEGTCSYDCKQRSARYHQMRQQAGQQNRKREAS